MRLVKAFLVVFLVLVFANAFGAEGVRFAWPIGLKAQVNVAIEGSRSVPGEGELKWDVVASYDMETEGRGNQILVHRRNFNGWHGSMPPKVSWIGDQIVDRVPTMVISSSGNFLGIEGAAEARQAARASAMSFGGFQRGRQVVFDTGTSDAGLTAVCQDYWATTMQLWLSRPLAIGKKIQLRNRTQVPQLGGGELDLVVDIENLGLKPCPIEGCDVQCVELTIRSRPDEEQVKSLISKMINGDKPTEFSQELSIKVLADPKTMLPHEIRFFRDARIGIKVDGEESQLVGGEICNRVYSYTYK